MFSRLRLRIRIKILCILWAVFLPPVYADELGDILAEVPGMIPGVIPGEIPWEMVLGPAFTIGNRGVLLDLTQGLKYIKKGFSLEELNRVPRAGEEEWRVLKAGESEDVIVKSIYGSSRVFLSPFSAPSQEYTILIPFNLGAERFTAPGGYFPANALYLGGIGENWAVYLNGELVQNEFYPRDRSMHRGVTVPVNSGLFLPGENILAFRVYGSSDAPDTGIYGPCYFSLLGALKDSLNDTLNLLMSGAFILIAILYFCLNFFIFKDREFNKLWTYIIFSVFCFCAALYYFTRTTMAFDLFKNTAILYAVETASFCFIGSTFWLYLDLTVHQKASPYAVGYGILCTIFSAAQIILNNPAFRQDMARLFMVLIIFPLIYLIIWDLVLPAYRFSKQEIKQYKGFSFFKNIGRYVKFAPEGWTWLGTYAMLIFSLLDILVDLFLHFDLALTRWGLLLFGISATVGIAVNFAALGRKVALLHRSSLRFVPSRFMDYLGVEDITRLKLGDSIEKELSVLFFDIRSFSVHSEMMSTPETFGFINRVLGAAGPVLRRYNGFVDKFIGDAAMVLFEDSGDAVQAGIELYRTLSVNRETRITIGGDPVGIGIGVHTGKMMLGIVGEEERLSSTVISENVNFASRLESLTRQTGSGMLISRDTMNAASAKFRREDGDSGGPVDGGETVGPKRRFIGMIQAAGVNGVTGVFDILDALPEELRQKRLSTKQTFESAVRRFHTRDYRGAAERFIQVLRLDPGDVCARICFEEAKKRLANPALPAVFMFDKK